MGGWDRSTFMVSMDLHAFALGRSKSHSPAEGFAAPTAAPGGFWAAERAMSFLLGLV